MAGVVHLASALLTFPSCRAVFHRRRPVVSVHLGLFAVPIVAQVVLVFWCAAGPLWGDFCHRVAGLIICPTHLGGSVAGTLVWLGGAGGVSAKCLLVLSVEMIFYFDGFANGQINKIS